MSELSDGSFLVFGGFVNGSRTNELAKFSMADSGSQVISAQMLQENSTQGNLPKPRASHSSTAWNDKLYVFGGQDDDNNKLEDIWEFDTASGSWREIQIQEGDVKPLCRSGHTAVTYADKMWIFGGILELTKELNDMIVFDFKQMKFVQGEQQPEYMDGSPERRQGTVQQDTYGDTSSPTRTQKGNSPTRRKMGASPTLKSPLKSRRLGSPDKQTREEGGAKPRDGLGSPTSVTMMNTFIIKNADQSFDLYH